MNTRIVGRQELGRSTGSVIGKIYRMNADGSRYVEVKKHHGRASTARHEFDKATISTVLPPLAGIAVDEYGSPYEVDLRGELVVSTTVRRRCTKFGGMSTVRLFGVQG